MKNSEIIKFLSSKSSNTSFVNKLKIRYRPVICPFPVLLAEIGDNNNVFDIGCGSGQFCALVAEFTGAQRIMGVEIMEELVKNAIDVNAEVKTKAMHFMKFDGKILPNEMRDYDVIFMIDVFHHIPKESQFAFMQEVFSKMASGAKLVFKDINAASPLVVFNKLHDLVFSQEIGNEISAKKAAEILVKIGFEIATTSEKTTFVYPHYQITCIKK